MRHIVLLGAIFSFVSASAAHAQAPAADTTTIARRYFDQVLNKGDLAAIEALVAADIVFHNPPAVVRGIEGFRKVIASLRAAFPDLHFTLEDEIAAREKVVIRWVMRGTQGTRKMDVGGVNIFLITGGKIKEIWVNMDTLSQARQLGLVPVSP